MKKLLFLSIALFSLALTSCNSCGKTDEGKNGEGLKAGDTTIVVENTISTDRQDMFLHYKDEYRWYETCIVLKDYLDDENCDGTVEGVSNIFQYIENSDGKTYDVRVVMYTHVGDSTQVDVKDAFWVGDSPMNDDAIKVTFKEAFAKMNEANCPKPHSRHCVLRKEIGPNDINPQYVFGNTKAQVYVDAVTGDVSTSNPAFPDNLKLPLGEWP